MHLGTFKYAYTPPRGPSKTARVSWCDVAGELFVSALNGVLCGVVRCARCGAVWCVAVCCGAVRCTHKHARTHARTHTHTHAHTHARTHAHTHTHMHLHMHMHTHTCTCTCTCTHARTKRWATACVMNPTPIGAYYIIGHFIFPRHVLWWSF